MKICDFSKLNLGEARKSSWLTLKDTAYKNANRFFKVDWWGYQVKTTVR